MAHQLYKGKKLERVFALQNDIAESKRHYRVTKASDLNGVGDLMMISARVFATAEQHVPDEYLQRVAAHTKGGWPDA